MTHDCGSCTKSFDEAYKLCMHEEDKHGCQTGPVSCAGDACNRTFPRKSSMMQHMERNGIHNPNIPLPQPKTRRRRRKASKKTGIPTGSSVFPTHTFPNISVPAVHPMPTVHPMAHSSLTAGIRRRSPGVVASLPDTSFLLTKDLAELGRFVSQELVPTETYNATLGKAMDEVASYLKEVSALNVKETFKGGSAGKATIVRHKSDIDSVVFLNDFSGESDLYQQQIKQILPQLEFALKQYNKQGLKSRVDVTGTTPFAVEIKLKLGSRTDEEIDFDILPAFDYLAQHDGKARLYQMMYCCEKEERRCFYSALSPLQVDFIKHRPPSAKNLIRLVKYWQKTHFEARPNVRIPTSYVLELVAVQCWQSAGEPEQFDLAKGFKAVMNELQNPRNIACQWNDNYEIAKFAETISKLKEDARKSSTPFILDPANPFNNTAAGFKTWDEVAKMARLSLQKMSDVRLTPGWK